LLKGQPVANTTTVIWDNNNIQQLQIDLSQPSQPLSQTAARLIVLGVLALMVIALLASKINRHSADR